MFDVGFWEMALISIVALVIIGPERLPAAARTAGLWIGRARRALREVRADINRELQAQDFADLDAIKRDVQSASDAVADGGGEAAKQSGAGDAAEAMRDAFQQASPLRDDDAEEDARADAVKGESAEVETREENISRDEANQNETNKPASTESNPA